MYGLTLFGLLVGAAAGLVITDTSANRDFRIAAGLPVDARPVIAGRPARITDGDTFPLRAVRIRLHGVDAPEMSTPDGQPARAHLTALIAASPGPLRCEDTGDRTYDRVVAQCFTADGRDLSAAMAEDGWATAMTRFSGWAYVPAQVRAVWERRGMYGD